MFQTYAVIGSGLSILGITFTYYFIRFIQTHKAETFSIMSLSESLITVCIGVFYIYSSVILSSNADNKSMFNFTNNIDDIVSLNTEGLIHSVYEQSTTNSYLNEDTNIYIPALEESYPTEREQSGYISKEELSESVDVEIENLNDTTETTTNVQSTSESNKKDDFLISYQHYIKDLIAQKLSNLSYQNRTVFYNNKEYKSVKTRTKRAIDLEKMEIPDDKCFLETFISNALFLYSILHCSLTLINNTLLCKMDEDSENKKENENSSNDSSSEKNDNSAPVGPLFNDSEVSTETIKELFKARSVCSLQNVITDGKKGNKKFKLITYIFLIWLLPIISVVIFYNILRSQNAGVEHATNYLNTLNLNSTQASPALVNIIQNPTNVTMLKDSVEVNNILKNVYNIVNEAQLQQNTITRKPHYTTSMLMDIIHFLNHRDRNSKDYKENCSIQAMSSKIYFFVFIVIYILVVLYAKVKQTAMTSQHGKEKEKLNTCILAFSFMWLPSVLELFFRIFLTQTKPNILTDVFLTLGNANRLFTMTADYTKSKKVINKSSVVQPVV